MGLLKSLSRACIKIREAIQVEERTVNSLARVSGVLGIELQVLGQVQGFTTRFGLLPKLLNNVRHVSDSGGDYVDLVLHL